MAYSEDYRKRVVQYIEAGHTQRETCATFWISFAALNDWLKKYRDTGEIKDKRPARQPKKLDPEKLKKYVEKHPDACLQEIGDAFGCTDTAVWKAFKRLGITRKKRQRGTGSRKQKAETVELYQAAVQAIPESEIVYVDETGIDSFLCREYGYSLKGVPIYGRISGRKFKRVGIVAAQREKEILAPLQHDGTMDSRLFEGWFQKCLLPSLPAQSTIVMDNAAFHRKKQLFDLAAKSNHKVLFLPPYSPELNPIENFWSWLKRKLKSTLHLHTSFDDALRSAFSVW